MGHTSSHYGEGAGHTAERILGAHPGQALGELVERVWRKELVQETARTQAKHQKAIHPVSRHQQEGPFQQQAPNSIRSLSRVM